MRVEEATALTLLLFIISITAIGGGLEQVLATATNIVINEIELNPPGTDSGNEVAELYNPSNNDMDVGGWSISSTAGRTATVFIDEGTIIHANSYLLISRESQWLDNVEEVIFLSDETGAVVDEVGPFSDEDNNYYTWQRSPDGSDSWILRPNTLGEPNVGTPVLGPAPVEETPSEEEPETTPPSSGDSDIDIGTDSGTSNEELTIVFIDVGQGDSTLVILPNGKTMLIDGGERDMSQRVLSVLDNHGIDRIDLIVATHPHADHTGGLIDVINSVPVGEVLDSGQIHNTQTFEDYLDAIESNFVSFRVANEGEMIELDPRVQLFVINPDDATASGNDNEADFNNNSIVIKLVYGQFVALFPGDIEAGTEGSLASEKNIDVDVLLASHHGSRVSNTAEYLAATSPEVVIIYAGKDNQYGHPHEEALQRINAVNPLYVFRTDMDGTLILTTDGSEEYIINGVVVPEFGITTTILVVSMVLVLFLIAFSKSRIWKSLRLV